LLPTLPQVNDPFTHGFRHTRFWRGRPKLRTLKKALNVDRRVLIEVNCQDLFVPAVPMIGIIGTGNKSR
jgi:hypothetical protein